MNAQEYNLNIRPGYGYSQTVKVSQDDIGRPLEFHLYDGMDLLSITVGSVITIHATKPSGLGFTETCTWSGSTASISTTESMTQESGAFPAELVITSGGDVLGTANFTFCVERSPHQTGTTDGVAEDLQDIYEQLDNLKEDLRGWSDDTKTALLNAFAHIAWTDEHGQEYYDALEDALYPEISLVSISAVYTQSGSVYNTDSLNSLKTDLVVTATYDDTTTATVTTYTLSGTLEVGTSTITVSYDGKTTTFTVSVTQAYTVTNQLVNCSTSDVSEIAGSGESYTATISADTGYSMDDTYITVTMGGVDITAQSLDDGVITIASVTGNIVIDAYATDALYPLKNGTFTFDNGATFTITKGYHVTATLPATPGDGIIDLSDLSENTSTFATADNVKNHSAKFTIPSGGAAVYKFITETAPEAYAGNVYGTGTSNLNMALTGNMQGTTKTASKTFNSNTDVGCLFCAMSYAGNYSFDVSFTVNGIKYV